MTIRHLPRVRNVEIKTRDYTEKFTLSKGQQRSLSNSINYKKHAQQHLNTSVAEALF